MVEQLNDVISMDIVSTYVAGNADVNDSSRNLTTDAEGKVAVGPPKTIRRAGQWGIRCDWGTGVPCQHRQMPLAIHDCKWSADY
jgi:hypothetical protein